MPAANPFAPVIDVGASASVGGATASGGISVGSGGVADNHASALYLGLAIVALYLLYKNKFRFSTTVG